MSFLTKYLEYELPTENLLAWYEFADETDSGPNLNDFSFIIQDSAFFDGGVAKFDNDYLETNLSYDSYSIFFDLERVENNEFIILSQRDASELFFGCTKNGSFFLKFISGDEEFVRFFHGIKIPNRSILIFSRERNNFSLTSYCPFTKKTKTQAIVFPNDLLIDSSSIKLGMNPAFSPQTDLENTKFNLYQFAIINVGAPSFVLTDLCEEFYLGNESDLNSFLYEGIAIKNKNIDFEIDAADNKGEETGILLTYSSFLDGFTFKDFYLSGFHRIFRNGTEESATEFSTHVSFPNQSPSDIVILDNFDENVTLEKSEIINNCIQNSVDYRIKDKNNIDHGRWISSFNHATKTYSFNVNSWVFEVDLTPYANVNPASFSGAMLISPQHFLCLTSLLNIGDSVRFFDKGFNLYERTIAEIVAVEDSNFFVCMLNEALPSSFSVVKFLPDDWEDILPDPATSEFPLLVINYEYSAVIKELTALDDSSIFSFSSPTKPERLIFDDSLSLDNENPISMIFNNQLILIGFLNGGSGDSVHPFKEQINNAIVACGGELYEIQVASLRRIPLRNFVIGNFSFNSAMFFRKNKRVFPEHIYLGKNDTSFNKNIIFKEKYSSEEIDFEFPAEISNEDLSFLVYNEFNLTYNEFNLICNMS